jgi:hypothetical protein
MAFILAAERDRDVAESFRRYRAYVEAERARFPPGALALVTSDWYFDAADHRCPHDGWLQHLVLHETGEGERRQERGLVLEVELLGAYHDLVLTFEYRDVYRYLLDGKAVQEGHKDWRYDEFRIADSGRLVHEVEWCGTSESGRWLIEAGDVVYTTRAFARGA